MAAIEHRLDVNERELRAGAAQQEQTARRVETLRDARTDGLTAETRAEIGEMRGAVKRLSLLWFYKNL